MKSDAQNVPEQAKAKRDGVINKPTKLQFQSILTQKILMLSKRYESTEVDRRTYTGQQKKGYKVICLFFYKTE